MYFDINIKYISIYYFNDLFQNQQAKATNVFKQEHNVDRKQRGHILGHGFRGCTLWFTGTLCEKWQK